MKGSEKNRQILFLVLSALWMGMIFSFSAQTGEASQSLSENYAWGTFFLLWPGFDRMSPETQQFWVQSVQFVLRKGAHFCVFAALGGLLLGTVRRKDRPDGKAALLAWSVGTAYAAFDEIHQLFVPGRSGELRDVLIDSAGVAAGVLGCLLLIWAGKKVARRRAARKGH